MATKIRIYYDPSSLDSKKLINRLKENGYEIEEVEKNDCRNPIAFGENASGIQATRRGCENILKFFIKTPS